MTFSNCIQNSVNSCTHKLRPPAPGAGGGKRRSGPGPLAGQRGFFERTNLHTFRYRKEPRTEWQPGGGCFLELSDKRELDSFWRNALANGADNWLLAEAISTASIEKSWPEFSGPGKCNVCQAVNEQFHGNIVTLLLALDSSVVSWASVRLGLCPPPPLVSGHSLGQCLPN